MTQKIKRLFPALSRQEEPLKMVFPFSGLAPRPALCWLTSHATESGTTRNFARLVSSRRVKRASYGAAILCGPADRRCWKHSRQYTGRPCVGLNGTVVSFPHCEHTVLVSTRCTLPEPDAVPAERLALHALHRLGSFLKPLSAKNICSPAVKTNSAEHSAHFKTRSWYSIRCSIALLEQE